MQTKSFAVIALMFASVAGAQGPTLSISPTVAEPGSIVRLTLRMPGVGSASIDTVTGTMSGEPLHFRRLTIDVWHAIGPVPVDAKGELAASAVIEQGTGAADTVIASVTLPTPKPVKSGGRARSLAVAPRFTTPLDAETEARIARENATAREIGRRAHETSRMWTAPFLRPARRITSRFGSGRMFNGTLTSRHLGVDFRGKVGAPVRAANRGVVALVDNFFLAGNVVYIDHGDGIVTAYFHLSKALVAQGDTVTRGQIIGRVGATGRVTGPHLHWSARYGAVTVNPLDLLRVGTY